MNRPRKSNLKLTRSTKFSRTKSKHKVSFSRHLVSAPFIDLPAHYKKIVTSKKQLNN